MFSSNDSSSPTSSLPTLADLPQSHSAHTHDSDDANSDSSSTTSEYIAPLSGHAPDPSIDGTSFNGDGEGGSIRVDSLADVTDDEKAVALKVKSDANKLFGESKYRESLDLYTASLNKNPFDPVVWSNRAAVRLKLEENGLAIADSTRAIELDPRAVKAYFRRAIANQAIMKPKAALVDLKKVLQLDPKNVSAKLQFDATNKLLRRLLFEEAISSKDEVAVSIKIKQQLADGTNPIEPSYAGPRLSSSNQPTKEFVDELKNWFKEGKLIPRRLAWEIVLGAFEVLKEENSLVEVRIEEEMRAKVVGDTHGQYYDLLHLLTLSGPPSLNQILVFNGDFVDRGSWSTEVVLLLFAYKWLYPKNVFLNRGNHETADMNKVYGFEGETKKKYSEMTYKLFEEVFTALPLATLLTCSEPPQENASPNPKNPTLYNGVKRFYIVHGGLFSRDEVTLSDIRQIDRLKQKQPGQEGLMCEMLWTDPQDQNGRGPSKRGVGIGFGPDVTRRWTEKNQVTAVLRSHEVRQGGYSVEHDGLLITVFSAPNYVDQVGNLAAFVTISASGELSYTTYKEQPHPNVKPMAYASGMMGGF